MLGVEQQGDALQKLIFAYRLGEKQITSGIQTFLQPLIQGVGGKGQNRDRRALLLFLDLTPRLGGVEAVHDRHLHIHQYQIKRLLLQCFDGLGAIRHHNQFIGLLVEKGVDKKTVLLGIIGHQNACVRFALGCLCGRRGPGSFRYPYLRLWVGWFFAFGKQHVEGEGAALAGGAL